MDEVRDARWLDADEQHAWRAVLQFCVDLMEGLDADLRAHDLDGADYEVLVRLSEQPERRLRMSELAASAWVSKSRLTYRIDRLERQGIVRREKCESDKRGAFAVLTPEGFALLERVAPHHVESARRRLLDRLSRDEFLELGRLARAVVDAGGPVTAGPAARPDA